MVTLELCDACNNGATAARYLVTLQSGNDLALCGHHYRQHETALLPWTVSVREIIDADGKPVPVS